MKQKEKVKKVEELYQKIQELFPKNSVGLDIHSINMDELDRDTWEVSGTATEDGNRYWTAKRKERDTFDITLFD